MFAAGSLDVGWPPQMGSSNSAATFLHPGLQVWDYIYLSGDQPANSPISAELLQASSRGGQGSGLNRAARLFAGPRGPLRRPTGSVGSTGPRTVCPAAPPVRQAPLEPTHTRSPRVLVPLLLLQKMRREFEYWYPFDLRVSGKDLIQVGAMWPGAPREAGILAWACPPHSLP